MSFVLDSFLLQHQGRDRLLCSVDFELRELPPQREEVLLMDITQVIQLLGFALLQSGEQLASEALHRPNMLFRLVDEKTEAVGG